LRAIGSKKLAIVLTTNNPQGLKHCRKHEFHPTFTAGDRAADGRLQAVFCVSYIEQYVGFVVYLS
jgi:hypothetical protein